MKHFLFISDFDGTMTPQDFFLQIMYRYEHDKIFSSSLKSGFELLSDVFGNIDLSEDDLQKEIEHIPLDPYFVDAVKLVRSCGGDFLILSAGCKYYIERKLKAEGINNIDIIANDGFYKNGGIELIKDREGSFYCEKFGIDKEKVVKHFRGKYETIAYAGDSFVDFDACKLCDFKFSRGRLDSILNLFAIDHYGFKNFSDIVNILKYKLK